MYAPYTCARVRATTTAHKARRRRSDRPRRDYGLPPGRPRPARSRPGAAGRTQRRRARLREITPHRWLPRASLAAAAAAATCAAHSPRTPPKLPQSARVAPPAGARVRRPLQPLRAVRRPPTAGGTGTRPQRCDGSGACADAANDAGKSWVARARSTGSTAAAAAAPDSAYGLPTWPHTRTSIAFFVRTHLAKATAAGGGEVGGDGNGGGDGVQDDGLRSDAKRGRCGAHRGACERGASHTAKQQPQAG